MRRGAQAHREAAQAAWETAASTKDEAEKTKAVGTYREEILKALDLENDARKIGTDLAEKSADATKKEASDRTALASAYRKYVEALYGENSPYASQAVEGERQAFMAESDLALAMGDTARAYDLAAQAVASYTQETRDANNAVQEALNDASAYVDYLRAIGQDKQADLFERGQMAQGQSALAQSLFAAGDVEGGYKAAAAAERYARAGKANGLFGEVPYANRALTTAAYGQQPVTVQINNQFSAGPDYQKRESRRVQADAAQANYYNAFAW
jgi:hypothetical protein